MIAIRCSSLRVEATASPEPRVYELPDPDDQPRKAGVPVRPRTSSTRRPASRPSEIAALGNDSQIGAPSYANRATDQRPASDRMAGEDASVVLDYRK